MLKSLIGVSEFTHISMRDRSATSATNLPAQAGGKVIITVLCARRSINKHSLSNEVGAQLG